MTGPLTIRCGCGHAFRVPMTKAGELCSCPQCGRGLIAPSARARVDGADALNPDNVPLEWRDGDLILGLYEVQGAIGRGGMGTVYRVRHCGWDIDLAVKTPRPTLLAKANGAELFERECETWVNLGAHPNVVNCYYVRRLGGLPRVFAEYVDGGSLDDWIADRRCYQGAPKEVLARLLDFAIQAAWGLRHAHEHGLVHNDIKPSNFLVTSEGDLKVTDFGLARMLEAGGSSSGHRRFGRFLGTPAYSPPEQAAGKRASFQSDMWSYALSILETFIGDRTWMAGTSAPDVLRGYVELGPDFADIPPMPKGLIRLLTQCFEEQPEARPRDFGEILAALEAIYRETLGEPYPRPAPKPSLASARQLSNRAISLLDLGKDQEAEAVWNSLLANYPDHREGQFNQGLHLWRTGQVSDVEIVRRLTTLGASAPDDWRPRLMLAHVHLERGDMAAAETALKDNGCPEEWESERSLLLETVGRRRAVSRGLIRSFSAHSAPVTAAFLSWDAHYGLTASENGAVKSWDMDSGKGRTAFRAHQGRVNSVTLTADGAHAVTAGEDGKARLWDLISGERVGNFGPHPKSVTTAAPSSDSRHVLTACMDGRIRVWEFSSGALVRELAAHRGGVRVLALAEMGRYALSGGVDGELRQWDYASGECQHVIAAHQGPVTALCLRRDARYALSAGEDAALILWEVSSGKPMKTLRSEHGPIDAIVMSRDGRFALASAEGGVIILWELKTGRRLYTFEGCAPLSLSGDGRFALCGGVDGNAAFWSVNCGELPTPAAMLLCRTEE